MDRVRSTLVAAAARLAAAGIAAAPAEAEWLLGHVVGRTRGRLVLAPPLTADQRQAFEALVERRARREPLQHLLGRAAFRHLDLRVGPGVFVPRPETELLVDAVRPGLAAGPDAVVVDLCAGSGALGLAVADEFAPATVVLVERSTDALRWLRLNAAESDAATTELVVVGADVRDPGLSGPVGALGRWRGRADVVLCNPPYVPTAAPIGPEVGYDPPEAVFAGADGMDLMDAVNTLAGRLLRPGGVFAVEHDETSQAAVLDRLHIAGGWPTTTGHQDLTGRPRFVTAVRGGPEPTEPVGPPGSRRPGAG